MATKSSAPCATNLAAVFIDDQTLDWLEEGGLGRPVSWPYPKYVHARLVRELKEEGATVVGFDILLTGARPDDVNNVTVPDKSGITRIGSSGGIFAEQLREASNVVLAVTSDLTIADLFRTNAWATANIEAVPDSDGVLRRARPYFEDSARRKIWHLGITLAARALNLDLSQAVIEPDRIVLPGPEGIRRVIPLDSEGNFLIDWRLPWNDARVFRLSYGQVLMLDKLRHQSSAAEYSDYLNELRLIGLTKFSGDNPFANKVVVVGSAMVGRNVTDSGPTPLSKETFLFSKYWNIANSVITDRFIHESPLGVRILAILLVGSAASLLTWRFGTLSALLSVLALAAACLVLGIVLYVQYLYWQPLVLPIFAAVLTYGGLTIYRVGFEQKEQRRVRRIFSRIVSPNIVNELLTTENLALGGARRRITVFFSDVRGFTEMTDSSQAKAEEYVRTRQLTGATAENYFDQRAREDLETVNLYLGLIADIIKKHEGTLDKYIGDCVMSFWGAPTPNDKHALACVRTAIEAQRAIHATNINRTVENKRRQEENARGTAKGRDPVSLLPVLSMGAGIHTGVATVGMMGSEAHLVNYTVFGREVNLASRLEGVSGRGRIIISEATYRDLVRDDPVLAGLCIEMPPVTLKGIRDPVNIYEVPWKQTASAAPPAEPKIAAPDQ